MVQICLIGAINLDVIYEIRKESNREILVEKKFLGVGGRVINTGIALKELFDIDATIVGAVGNDRYGRLILRKLKKVGLSTEGIEVINNARTGIVFILVQDGDHKLIISQENANKFLSLNQRKNLLERCDVIYMAGKIEPPQKTKQKQLIIWSPTEIALREKRYVEEILKIVDVIIGNENEINMLASILSLSENNPQDIIKKLPNIQTVVRTLGSKGSESYIKDKKTASIKVFRAKTRQTHAIDPTGAGDAFLTGYIATTILGLPEQKKLETSNLLGSICVKYYGGTTYIRYEKTKIRKIIRALIKKHRK